MDTGVDGQHPDLNPVGEVVLNSWFDPYSEFAQPHDGMGHGTQVMGVMVGGDASGKVSELHQVPNGFGQDIQR